MILFVFAPISTHSKVNKIRTECQIFYDIKMDVNPLLVVYYSDLIYTHRKKN